MAQHPDAKGRALDAGKPGSEGPPARVAAHRMLSVQRDARPPRIALKVYDGLAVQFARLQARIVAPGTPLVLMLYDIIPLRLVPGARVAVGRPDLVIFWNSIAGSSASIFCSSARVLARSSLYPCLPGVV